MKSKIIKPEIEVIEFSINNIIATSGGESGDPDSGKNGNDGQTGKIG